MSVDTIDRVKHAVDILILSNGPGEVATWVKPVVRSLRQQLGDDRDQVRISVVLSPCANASGQEAESVKRYPEVDRVQAAEHFFPFLLRGKTVENWDWRSRGVVIFLGGDQIFPLIVGRRLGYQTVIYAEWEARWVRWIDRFAIMRPEIAAKHPQAADKFTVVGDLMAEAGAQAQSEAETALIGLLPGSKAAKLSLGVPLTLAIAEHLHDQRPDLQFVLPVAPMLTLEELARYADPQHNPLIERLGWGAAELVKLETSSTSDLSEQRAMLKTRSGVAIALHTEFPAYHLLAQCQLCLTTVGANTAELGALAVPMLVLLPTQQLDIMRAWDGIPGLLANLPGVGSGIASVINWFFLRRRGLLAWPNIWAGAEIVPELVGPLQPAEVAGRVLEYLEHPETLAAMRDQLRHVRGQPGAARRLAEIVSAEIDRRSSLS